MTKIIKTSWFPFRRYDAVAIWPRIFVKGECKEYVVRHEEIHIRQQKELLLIGFYLLYAVFYVYLFLKFAISDWGCKISEICDKAYRANPLEREAYGHQHDPDYLDRRRHFAWIRR